MRCPIDNSELEMTERHGVEIDYCPNCRGVWLDRGELDKIIDRAAISQSAPVALEEPPRPAREERRDRKDKGRRYRDDDDDDDEDDYRSGKRGKRYKSFLSEIFDF
ncbi:zf-TFIIB domain-containing protein [Ostreiculturibacter nitratireducens]|uniref:TFIIB-type zinc ribbon-containing protein n=1 Tax=Ostreiculturibacter nitratireducens TaxID=3075226 RepID=UPI0031B56651